MNKKAISLPCGASNICIAKQNGEVVKFNVEDVKEIFCECE